MPKREDIKTIMLIGSGPIVIGQGCEFDYSGTQACKALRAEGYRVVLINSNPATIMTDPEFADRTYIEPITSAFVDKILAAEAARGQPVDALLPTLGGQTGLNCAMECHELGILEKHGVELIGASPAAIAKAEDRTAFKQAMIRIGLDVPKSDTAHNMDEAREVLARIGLPCCIRPAYTLGGEGGGFCRTMEEFETIAARGIKASRISEVLIEESLYGWKEYELEVIRDRKDNVVIVCSIENIDPMGVHTGDSITVAPAQTLTDREYQKMRDAAKAIMREIGVDTGGSNVQFAVDPKSGRQCVIEMNPRVSRSSALASKATGYPIAKVAAKLAVGYTLDEIPNDITRNTPASFEPVIDYCVVKIPRWTFEKFPEADETLTTQMKSVGEAMAIGRTFKEAFQKCVRSMEIQRPGYGLDRNDRWLSAAHKRHAGGEAGAYRSMSQREDTSASDSGGAGEGIMVGGSRLGEAPPDVDESTATSWPIDARALRDKLEKPCQGRPYYIRYAFKMGWTVDQVHELTRIDRWFLDQWRELVEFEEEILSHADQVRAAAQHGGVGLGAELLRRGRLLGYSGAQLAQALQMPAMVMPKEIHRPADDGSCYKLVDTCAAEFEAATPYYYSTHEEPLMRVQDGRVVHGVEDELKIQPQPHVVVLGGGPNRIGQGIEFDYCCVHAAMEVKRLGYRAVMVNSNPETVSTDYDTSDVLFFEPLTLEDVTRVLRAIAAQGQIRGVIVQFGGQTPLNLAEGLKRAGAPIIGTPPESIHLAEDRDEFQKILNELGLLQPANGIARSATEAREIAARLGYPVLIRPSYVLGGRAMELCNNEDDLIRYVHRAFEATDRANPSHGGSAGHPVLIDKFLLDATEIDVDAVADFRTPGDPNGDCVVCGIMEHIEQAGIHSGDSSCAIPPHSLSGELIREIERQTQLLARRLGVCGLMNVQFAIAQGKVYVLEVNPRASRTVPFVSKATGVPWAKVATAVMLGGNLRDQLWERGVGRRVRPVMTSIKAPVFPFNKFPGVDAVLGPEMRSTGEVMGIDDTFGLAFAKAAIATRLSLPTSGNALVSVNDPDKPRIVPIARELVELGFKLFATVGTHAALKEAGIHSVVVSKRAGAPEGFLLDLINHGVMDLLINTPVHYGAAWEEGRWRAAAVARNLPLITTISGAQAAVAAIRAMKGMGPKEALRVRALQDYAAGIR
ncbi:MAG: carbamoyl-phosphate synthase large chain [Phycisphaerae bacterium]|nr:MAG: carbamoyl-phosphate synthase large subunit [Planctomycetia bacterium]GJQ25024.1 MAG: carbamoyl-phosphate synthase large chain [Phycisphaerae bacterium]